MRVSGGIFRENKPELLRGRTVVIGFPGMAFIGKMTAEVLVEKLKLERIVVMYPIDAPGVVPVSDGLLKPPAINLYGSEESSIVVLTSDFQPRSDEGMNRIAHELLEYLAAREASAVLAAAAFVKPAVSRDRVVYVASSSKRELEKFESLGCIRMDGGISGLNGLVPGLAPAYGMNGSVLLGETSELFVASGIVDYRAVACVLRVISKAFNLNIDLTDIMEKAEETEKKIREAIEAETRKARKGQEEEPPTHM